MPVSPDAVREADTLEKWPRIGRDAPAFSRKLYKLHSAVPDRPLPYFLLQIFSRRRPSGTLAR